MKIFFVICLLLSSSTLLFASHNSLEEACKKATKSEDNYEYCVTTLQVVPRSQTADIYNLTTMLAELTKTNFTYAYAKYQQLSKQNGLSNKTLSSIHVCLENYSDTDLVDGTISLAKEKKYDTMGLEMAAVGTAADTCQEAFEEIGEKSPIPKVDDDVSHLACLAMAFASLCENT